MTSPEGRYKNLCHLFTYYLHQDWTIEGGTLTEVFKRNQSLHEISKGIQEEARTLLEEGHGNQYLDGLFFGRRSAGYEPEAEGEATWHDTLRKIITVCGRYTS
jgi:hypothetical protein